MHTEIRLGEAHIAQLEAEVARQVAELHRHRREPRDVNNEFVESLTPLERIARFVTDRVGTFGFFLMVATWTVAWLGWNTLAPRTLRFDPAPAFVLWLFISNMIQILLMPLIMVGQNLQGRHTELRAENDFEVNKKAEQEVQAILLHLEHQTALLSEILARLPQHAPDDPNP